MIESSRTTRRGALVLTAGATSAAQATTYYVNSATGNDRAAGTTADQPWRSLARVRDYPLMPGDQVLLMAGSRWQEPLTITRSGRSGAPISVAAFGTGARPRIDAGGVSPHGVGVINAEYVSVSGLEVTNDNPAPAQRFGVLVSAVDRGVTRGIRISDIINWADKATRIKNKMIILDCCESGSAGEVRALRSESSMVSEGMTILTACKKAEPALEGAQQAAMPCYSDSDRDGEAQYVRRLLAQCTGDSILFVFDDVQEVTSERTLAALGALAKEDSDERKKAMVIICT